MPDPQVNWKGARFAKAIRARLGRNLNRAAVMLVGEVKKSFGSPARQPRFIRRWRVGRYVSTAADDHRAEKYAVAKMLGVKPSQVQEADLQRYKKAGGTFSPEDYLRSNSTKAWKRAHPSMPGSPPNVQTGTLRRSITWDSPSDTIRRVGSTMQTASGGHALYLELGTWKMRARPYLRPMLATKREEIHRTIVDGIPGMK